MSHPVQPRFREQGEEALSEARWDDARKAFQAAVDLGPTPEALDGLGRALWWLGETAEALSKRARAYSAYEEAGMSDSAARIALWLSLEYSVAAGDEAVAAGWLGRAERLLEGASSPVEGWLALARSGLETDPVRVAVHADTAREVAREAGDVELEIRALARSGLARVKWGRVDEGMALLDEAMAAASASEAQRPETFAETCCDMVAACEIALDGRRLEQWGKIAERFLELRTHPPLVAFCGSCCAGLMAAMGDLASAEYWLTWTIDKLEKVGHKARCVDPRARLAELRIFQGRFEEAERLLAGIEGRPEAIRPVVELHVERGELATASSLLHKWLGKIGAGSMGAMPILALLVPIQIARQDLDGAAESANRIASLAEQAGGDRHLATADLAQGRVAMARGARGAALGHLDSAVSRFDRVRMALDAAIARLDLARALVIDQPELAVAEGRVAAAALERAGARHLADQADSLVRSWGGRGRVGPKGTDLLTQRETEVLALLAEGLTNAGIAERLFISAKTAGNHVSNVLMKLNLKSRTEAAAYALRQLSGP